MKSSSGSLIKRNRSSDFPDSLILSRKRHRPVVANVAYVQIKILGLPLISSVSGSSLGSIRLEPFRSYTIGRHHLKCEFVFEDRRVSKRHFQIRFDAVNRKVWIGDGMCLSDSTDSSRVSLNGLFVDGVKVARGEAVELRDASEVSLVCRNLDTCGSNMGSRIGFVVHRIVYKEEVIDEDAHKIGLERSFISDVECNRTVKRVNSLLYKCRQVLESTDPISCIQKCIMRRNYDSSRKSIGISTFTPSCDAEFPVGLDLSGVQVIAQSGKSSPADPVIQNSNAVHVVPEYSQNSHLKHADILGAKAVIDVAANGIKDLHSSPVIMESDPQPCEVVYVDSQECPIPPPGSKFCLNRLKGVSQGLLDHHVVSLPELLHPVESLSQIFIATFTCDILWFLSYCEISPFLPVTVACHDRTKCWSSSPNERILMPYSDYPNVTVVYPPFPESIAFGTDRKKLGIACHHPKLFVLQRDDCIRVVITSANLVPKQWNNVTNTVWWQDFPRRSTPDYAALFADSFGTEHEYPKSDFAAQLAGFISSLVVGIPSKAHWVTELTEYEFKEATGHLVASVSGVHSQKPLPITSSMYHLPDGYSATGFHKVKILGSIDTMVVGLGHLFQSRADSTGAKLKKLADFIGRCRENENGMLEVILRRNTNIKADANAVSVLVPDPEDICGLDGVQIGFLPRDVAKWVAPLSDSSMFRFSGYICPKEVLAAALGGSSGRVQLILYVSQGSAFSNISKIVESKHTFAICCMVALVQRCTGIWRLQEVLSQYKWPEELETDFFFGSSSVGSVNAQFLAAFSAAAGKTTPNICESEESDPDWGCWSASQELINPSIRIIFPTIQRVINSSSGIFASKYMLCFSEKTWQRLKNVNILHDAVPCPSDRVGIPMHVKVARRRFQSKRGGVPFGWVYCGSHNFSAAAWGRPLSSPNGISKLNRPAKINSVTGSRLHISNYELGIIFIVPPPNNTKEEKRHVSLDDIMLPFVTPAPKYRGSDRPATARAMKEAWIDQLSRPEKEIVVVDDSDELMEEDEEEEVPDEEDEVTEQPNGIENEEEGDKAYAEVLWCQVDDSS
ncbi:uncharacterized protein LOC124920456 [Impatiens glandulifera]|uniref:uncharacterized protein LOC124920456 n=1 Tax=Impatiens glandulifera TaxID=253017 RepID=UPI001FB0CB29|nr:uncharacterized protein LOC124920456 [Impatiens glandulifera]